jgi:V8-like Glu-specific endopeptidase
MRKFLAFVLVLLAACASPAPAMSGSEQNDWRATFVLYATIEKETKAICTATAFKKSSDGYFLLTAGHCVDFEDAGIDSKDVSFSVAENVTSPVSAVPVTVLTYKLEDVQDFPSLDYAILDLKTKNFYPTIPLSKDPNPPFPGAEIYFVHASNVLTKQLARGYVSSSPMTSNAENGKCDICKGRFVVSATAAPGASGSSVIDKSTGKIIGVVEITLDDSGDGGYVGVGVEPISAIEKNITIAK